MKNSSLIKSFVKNLYSIIENIEYLIEYDYIEELNPNNENCIVFKTNLRITTTIPIWMRELLPKELNNGSE